jgi:hypothetical protein
LAGYVKNTYVYNGFVINNSTVTGGSYTGGLIGLMEDRSTVSSCAVENGTVSGSLMVGGLVGMLSTGNTVQSSYANTTVSGDENVGGLVGKADGTLAKSYHLGSVSGTRSLTGGVAGVVNGGTVKNCYSIGNVSGGTYVGGVAGFVTLAANVERCYSIGAVSGTSQVGGIAGGVNMFSSLSNCAALNSSVTATEGDVGRIAGFFDVLDAINNNIAWAGIAAGGTAFSGANTGNGLDGEDISTADVLAGGTYGNRFLSANGWTTANGELPFLVFQETMPAYITLPTAPINLTATAGDEEVTIAWATPVSAGSSAITGYEYSAVTATGTTSWTAIPGSDASTVSYVVTGLTNETKYYFSVRAKNSSGTGPASAEVMAKPVGAVMVEVDSVKVGGAASNQGSIELLLSIPSSSTIIGTFKLVLPAEMHLDSDNTKLVDVLQAAYQLLIAAVSGENAWTFTISARPVAGSLASLRSAPEITKIMDIAFSVDEDAVEGDYEIKLESVNLKLKSLEDGTETAITNITEMTVQVPVTRAVAVSGITISPASLSGQTGGTAQLTANVSPSNATDATVTWSSSNEAVATVSATGLVSYVAPGTATITATANDGSNVTASITATVTSPPDPDPDPTPDPDLTAVYAAIDLIQLATIEIPQSAGSTEAEVGKWLTDYLNALPGNYGVSVSGVAFSEFTAATPGSLGNVHGTDGAVTFSALFSKGSASAQASFIHGIIKALPYEGSSNEAAAAGSLKAVSEGGQLLISGLNAGAELKVYNATGVLIYNVRKVEAAEVRVDVAPGIYIIASGKSTIKAVAK